MEPPAFSDSRVKEIYDSYNFILCNSKYAVNEPLETETIEEQEKTEEACRKAKAHLEKIQGKDAPLLVRQIHINFLLKQLHGLSHEYIALEGSRTWIVFWCVNGLRILNHPIEHSLAHRIVTFLAACQQPTGGFGGSPSHIAHIATTYASVMALASIGTEEALKIVNRIVTFLAACQQPTGGFGGSPSHIAHIATTYASVMALASIGTEEALKIVNRKTLYEFILSLKQPNGSFIMHKGGEVDIRGVYCAAAVASLTRIMDSKLFEGTPAWIISCQTYEGGFAAEPFVEAHVASLTRIMDSQLFEGTPAWIISCQTYEGGFAAEPFVEAHGYTYCGVAALAIFGKLTMMNIDKLMKWSAARQMAYEGGFQGRSNKLVDACYSFWMAAIFPIVDYELNNLDDKRYDFGGIFEPEGLQRYLLELCQNLERGGLRDKPEKNPDAYHTCYGLAGLSVAQHYSMREKETVVGGKENTVEQINPLYNIVCQYHQLAFQYFEKQPGIVVAAPVPQ
uniref:Protein farnesyltransferase subunit beta n=1 Tax=Panagrolaimus sp. ES5 TaxID=591445 RepID=A0AC34FVV9_9BILA